jgi:hypothetical protein
MKILNRNIINKKKAVTLTEIMLAVFILAFTFIPVIGTIIKSAKDTDVFNSYVFAQTTARNILDTILDDVPFHSIQNSGTDNIAGLVDSEVYVLSSHTHKTYKVEKIMKMFGSSATSGDAKGILEDKNRGIKYNITLYVFPITASTDGTLDKDNEMTFTYLPRGDFGKETNWYTYDKNNLSSPYRQTTDNPYDKPIEEKEIKNAQALGVKVHKDDGCDVIKKLVLTIEWQARDNIHRKISLYTMKANLDSEQ